MGPIFIKLSNATFNKVRFNADEISEYRGDGGGSMVFFRGAETGWPASESPDQIDALIDAERRRVAAEFIEAAGIERLVDVIEDRVISIVRRFQ